MWQTLAFVSAIFSALAAISEKKALQKLQPLEFSLLVSAVTLVLSIPFLLFSQTFSVPAITLWVLYGKSVLGAVSFLLLMYGIKHLDISKALPLMVITPGLVALFAFLWLNEPLGAYEIMGMGLLLSGTYFLQLQPGSSILSPFKFAKTSKAYWFIAGAILLYTATTLLDKTLLKTYKLAPELFLPIQQLFLTLNFTVFYRVKNQSKTSLRNSFLKYWKIIVIIAILTVVYRYTQILALKIGAAALVLSIKRISVLFATIFGGRYFNEQHLVHKSIATLIMVIGAILLII